MAKLFLLIGNDRTRHDDDIVLALATLQVALHLGLFPAGSKGIIGVQHAVYDLHSLLRTHHLAKIKKEVFPETCRNQQFHQRFIEIATGGYMHDTTSDTEPRPRPQCGRTQGTTLQISEWMRAFCWRSLSLALHRMAIVVISGSQGGSDRFGNCTRPGPVEALRTHRISEESHQGYGVAGSERHDYLVSK